MSNLKKLFPFLTLAILLVACAPAESAAPEEVAFVASTEDPALTESAPTEEIVFVPLPTSQAEACILAGLPEDCMIDDSVVAVIAEQTGIECDLQPGDWSPWTYYGNASAGQTQSGTLSCPVPSQSQEDAQVDLAVTIAANSVSGVVVGGDPEVGAVVNLKVVGNGDTHIMDATKDKGKHKGWDVVDGEETISSSASSNSSNNAESAVSSSSNPSSDNSNSGDTSEASPPGCDSSGGKPPKCNP